MERKADMNSERAKNELILAMMQEKHDDSSKYVPLIALTGTILTAIIIIAWTIYLF